MDTQPEKSETIRKHLMWADNLFDWTEKIAELVPEEMLDWRPTDPSGKFCFSFAETIIHIADSRRFFARTLSGKSMAEDMLSENAQDKEGQDWKFKAWTRECILKSLKDAREELNEWLESPVSESLEPNEAAMVSHLEHIKMMKDAGKDTEKLEAAGPASPMRYVCMALAHESGHRGSMLTLLREKGINLPAAF